MAADETSSRARIASRAPSSSSSRPRRSSAETTGRPAEGREGRCDRGGRAGERLAVDRDSAARLAGAVAHALLPQPEPEPVDDGVHRVAARQDELRTHLDDRAVAQRLRPDTPADAVARLEDDDLDSGTRQRVGGRQSRQARADDRDAH